MSRVGKFLVILVALIAVLSILGCESDDYPSEPGTPGTSNAPVSSSTGLATDYANLYGPIYDPYTQTPIFSLSPHLVDLSSSKDSFEVNVNVDMSWYYDAAFVYRYGYYYANGRWNLFPFDEAAVGNTNWIVKKATARLVLPSYYFNEGETYIVAYACMKKDGNWQCGAQYQGDTKGKWMLNSFVTRAVETPPEPMPPDSPYIMTSSVFPNSELVPIGQEFTRYGVYFNSVQDVLSGMSNVKAVVTAPDGSKQSYDLSLEKYNGNDDSQCYANDFTDNSYFYCYANYYGQASIPMTQDGEYSIDYTADGIDMSKVYNYNKGSFMRFDFAPYLLDVEGYNQVNHYGYFYSNDQKQVYLNYRESETDKWYSVEMFLNGHQYDCPDPVTISGQQVCKILYPQNYYSGPGIRTPVNWVVYRWNSGSTSISLEFNTPLSGGDDSNALLLAFLEKYPSSISGAVCGNGICEAGEADECICPAQECIEGEPCPTTTTLDNSGGSGCGCRIGTCPQDCVKEFTLADYPGLFIKDGSFDVTLVIGTHAVDPAVQASDVQAATDIYTGAQYFTNPDGSTIHIEGGTAKLDTEISDPASMNLLLIGRPSDNSVTAQVIGIDMSDMAHSGIPENKGLIKLVKQSSGKLALIVAGWRPEDTQRAAFVLANYKDYAPLAGTEVYVTGTTMSDISVEVPGPETTTTIP